MEDIEIFTKKFIERYTECKESVSVYSNEVWIAGGLYIKLNANNKWEMAFTERGSTDVWQVFDTKEMACFALAMYELTSSSYNKQVDLKDTLKLFTEKDVDKIKQVFSKVFDNDRRYELFDIKNEAVVLKKERENKYSIVYYDDISKEYNIFGKYELKNIDFNKALRVLYNYSWVLYSLDKLIPKWPMKIDKNSQDYLKVIKLLLSIKE
jgi:tetratricopeptide (TPR) repeat protein